MLVEEIKSRVHNLYIILQQFAETAQVPLSLASNHDDHSHHNDEQISEQARMRLEARLLNANTYIAAYKWVPTFETKYNHYELRQCQIIFVPELSSCAQGHTEQVREHATPATH